MPVNVGGYNLTSETQEFLDYELDGSTLSRAAPSAIYLRDTAGVTTSGVYYIQDGLQNIKRVYCDMVNDGGGWMLYQSFASTNTLTATDYPAWNTNNLLLGDLTAAGWEMTYYSSYSDGDVTTSYSHRNEWFGFFYSGSPNGLMDMTSFYGPSSITQIRIRHGMGKGSYGGPSGYLSVNGASEVFGGSGAGATTDTVATFSPTYSGNMIRLRETGIYGLSWIYIR